MAAGWIQRVVDAGELFESVMSVMSVMDMVALVVEGVCGVQVSFDAQVIVSLAVVAGVVVWDLFAQGASDGGARDS